VIRVSHTSNKECIASKHRAILAVFEKVADAVLRVTGRMQCFDFDAVANREGLSVPGCL